VWLLLLLAPCAADAAPQSASQSKRNDLFQTIDDTVRQLSHTTGFALRRQIAYDMINRAGLKEFLEKRIREEIKPEEIRIEEMLLKKFGFVPLDFDLKKTTIDLYTEQAAAFYDFKSKKLYVLESSDTETQEAALVHELAHALADQHFRLQRYLDRAGKNDDGALARMAVLEGQATWLMAELSARTTGKSLADSPDLFDVMARMIGSSSGEFPVLDEAPLYLRESLLFPYTSGMKFQQAVVQKMGQAAFAEVFRRPPATTQQVLHPEKYLKAVQGKTPKVPRLSRAGQYEGLAEGTVGEFDYAILLRQYIGEDAARRIAPAWVAASYSFLEHKQEKRTVLMHVSVWHSPDMASEFFAMYRKVLAGKWKSMEILERGERRLAGRGDDGHFLMQLDGTQVLIAEGLSSPQDLK
jgi:hypothetical protein